MLIIHAAVSLRILRFFFMALRIAIMTIEMSIPVITPQESMQTSLSSQERPGENDWWISSDMA